MSTTSLTSVLRELFAAPLDAATQAEANYRQIWAAWLSDLKNLVVDESGEVKSGVNLPEMIKTLSPTIALDGKVDLAVTMRVASVQEKSGTFQAGLSLAPIFASGSFSSSATQTEESVLKASTSFVLSNTNRDLSTFLDKNKLTPTDVKELDNAIKFLKNGSAQGLDLPVIQVALEDDTLDFGEVAANETKEHTFTIKNLGTATLTIKTLAFAGSASAFTVTPASLSVDADQSESVTVTFAPTEAKSYSDKLTLTHNAPKAPATTDVTVEGTGK